MNKSKADEQTDTEPTYYGRPSLEVVDAKCLLSAVEIESGLVLGNLTCGKITLAPHAPNCGNNFLIGRYFITWNKNPGVVVNVAVDFLDDGFNKLAA